MTQKTAILEHMRKGQPITPLEALSLYGCLRLGARIWDLKNDGWEIESAIVEQNGKHFAAYRLVQTGQQSLFSGSGGKI